MLLGDNCLESAKCTGTCVTLLVYIFLTERVLLLVPIAPASLCCRLCFNDRCEADTRENSRRVSPSAWRKLRTDAGPDWHVLTACNYEASADQESEPQRPEF